MNLPKVGDEISRRQGEKLCRHFGLHRTANRIASRPGNYRKWVFDGCSGVPDGLLSNIHALGWDWEKILVACLKHDLRYAYGIPGDKEARLFADSELRTDLSEIIPEWGANLFYYTVRVGGVEWTGLGFRWAFAVV